jgi:hypothetical protein
MTNRFTRAELKDAIYEREGTDIGDMLTQCVADIAYLERANARVAELVARLDAYLDNSTVETRMDLIDARKCVGGAA